MRQVGTISYLPFFEILTDEVGDLSHMAGGWHSSVQHPPSRQDGPPVFPRENAPNQQ